MSDCSYEKLLEAYHDGEIKSPQREEIAGHVIQCPQCAAELRALEELSNIFASAPRLILSPDLLAQFHDQVDSLSHRSLIRYAEALSAIAALLLIAATLWLMRAPPDIPEPASPWEGVAVTLRTETSNNSSNVETAEWIVAGLSQGNQHE